MIQTNCRIYSCLSGCYTPLMTWFGTWAGPSPATSSPWVAGTTRLQSFIIKKKLFIIIAKNARPVSAHRLIIPRKSSNLVDANSLVIYEHEPSCIGQPTICYSKTEYQLLCAEVFFSVSTLSAFRRYLQNKVVGRYQYISPVYFFSTLSENNLAFGSWHLAFL
jgi:hypothetical protein